MTDVLKLFSGIGVVIDDEVNRSDSSICKIINSLEENNIPILKYEELPPDLAVQNMHSVSFVLLDWKWNPDAPDNLLLNDNVAFMKNLLNMCFVPIFIFTNEDPNSIIKSLVDEHLYKEEKNNLIFVKHKDEIDSSDRLFTAIDDWVKSTLSVYVIKEWENKKRLATKRLFQSLYETNPNWVNVVLCASKKDGVDEAYELDNLLFENLHSQMNLMDLKDIPVNSTDNADFNASEIREILQGQRFLSNDKLLLDMIFTGDIYLDEKENTKDYYINVRPQCDCIPRNGMRIDDLDLYLLKGTERALEQCNYNKRNGNFSDTETKVTVFPINHKVIQFELAKFSIKKFSEMRSLRIGRLLPPFITKLVQKYALYMQRQALPRIPEEATKYY